MKWYITLGKPDNKDYIFHLVKTTLYQQYMNVLV